MNFPLSCCRPLTGLVIACSVLLALTPRRAQADTIVDTTDDVVSSPDQTLREAIDTALDGDTIRFDASLSGATITLSLGQLAINDSITIDASDLPEGITIDANQGSRVFSIGVGKTVTLNALVITGGKTADGADGVNGGNAEGGGGILNRGTLTINDSTISGNATGRGGDGSSLGGEGGPGGGISNGTLANPGTLIMNRCTLAGNSTGRGGDGGGLSFPGGGGGINNPNGNLTLNQCTVMDNSTGAFDSSDSGPFGLGGGILHIGSAGTFHVNQSTVTGNQTGPDGDGAGIMVTNSTILNLSNSIVADNLGNDDISDADSGSVVGTGINFIGDTTGLSSVPAGTLTGDAMLAPPGFYGGRAQTRPPMFGSPVIDPAGGNASSGFATDQRGMPRVVDSVVDIGAVESQPFQSATILMFEDFEPSGSQRINSTWTPTQSSGGSLPAVSGSRLRLTTVDPWINNSVAWDVVPTPNPELTLCVDFTMSPDDVDPAADGFGIGFFHTAMWDRTGARNPATNDAAELIWEDLSVLPSFPGAIVVGLDVFNGGTDRVTFISPGAGGAGVLRFTGDPGFDLNTDSPHRLRLTLREDGPDTLATLVLEEDILAGFPVSYTVFDDLVLPDLRISEFPARVIAGGRTGAFTVETFLDNVMVATPATVTTLADENDPPGTAGGFSLREAIRDAELICDPVVRFAPGLSGGTIKLGGTQLLIDKDLGIDASRLPGGITVDGCGNSRVFEIATGNRVVMDSLTITGGQAGKTGDTGNNGGGILNHGELSIIRSTITGNHTDDGEGLGGGGQGGAIYSTDILALTASTITGNTAGDGGAAGGLGGFGGGIYQTGFLQLRDTTIVDNAAGDSALGVAGRGGGVANRMNSTMNLINSIIAGNTDFGLAPDIFADQPETVTTSAFDTNFVGNPSQADLDGATGILTGDPELAPLADFGGPTMTMPPLPGTAVIDAGVFSPLTTDQRGGARVTGPALDVGAVEAFAFHTLPLVDVDDDGIDDRLEPAYPQFTVGVDDSALDTDHDGQTDADELRAMTDPDDPDSRLKIVSLTPIGGSVYQIEWTSFPGLTYDLDVDGNLDFTGPDYTLIDAIPANPFGYTSLAFPTGAGGTGFFRVRLAP